jgi:hypothetical protein
MSQSEPGNLPDELREIEEKLRAARPSFTQLELDQLKLRTMAKASSSRPLRGKPMRSRILTLAVGALLIGGTTGGAIAAGGAGGSSNAAKSQYKPGNGCGDKNHDHTGPPGNPNNHKCPPQAGGGNGNGGGNGKGGDNSKGNTKASTTTTSKAPTTPPGKGNGKK